MQLFRTESGKANFECKTPGSVIETWQEMTVRNEEASCQK